MGSRPEEGCKDCTAFSTSALEASKFCSVGDVCAEAMAPESSRANAARSKHVINWAHFAVTAETPIGYDEASHAAHLWSRSQASKGEPPSRPPRFESTV